MQLLQARLVGVGPFSDVVLSFRDERGGPRRLTVVHGTGGVGKTTVVSAIASTRPGYAVAAPGVNPGTRPASAPHVICDWIAGDDEVVSDEEGQQRPVCVASPNVRVLGDDQQEETLRRREQALLDQLARGGGFVFVAVGSARWFSRQPFSLNAPARTVARYDVHAPFAFDDASRSDLSRETKQALAYTEIGRALSRRHEGSDERFERFGDAMHSVVDRLAGLSGFSYAGLDPRSLEPEFDGPTGRRVQFDALPTRVRHLVAFGALPVRALAAAYPDCDPRAAEGVVAIDEVDLHQDVSVQGELASALCEAMPRVQWILTTASSVVAASVDVRNVFALRRLPEQSSVELFAGSAARTH